MPDRGIIDVLESDREFACGGQATDRVAAEWGGHGFGADEVRGWLDARCFDAAAAAALRAAGVTPEQARATVDEGPCEGETIGYAVANGDLSAARAAKIVEGWTDEDDLSEEWQAQQRDDAGYDPDLEDEGRSPEWRGGNPWEE